MIEAVGLTKTFTTFRGKTVTAVSSASFRVQPGEVFGLLGPNGAGKTTLLRMLGHIIVPTSGYCVIKGVRSDQALDEIRRHIGFHSGNTKLYGRLTARETLRYFGQLSGMSTADIDARTKELAHTLAFEDLLDRRCDTLSTGQLQKVSIARVILHDPQVLILDEPTLGLDILTSQAVLKFITDARARGRAVILSTHYLTEAEILCDRIGFIHAGKIMAEGTRQELYAQTGTQNLNDAFMALAGQGAQP
mgnify:CR=1 FL=1